MQDRLRMRLRSNLEVLLCILRLKSLLFNFTVLKTKPELQACWGKSLPQPKPNPKSSIPQRSAQGQVASDVLKQGLSSPEELAPVHRSGYTDKPETPLWGGDGGRGRDDSL